MVCFLKQSWLDMVQVEGVKGLPSSEELAGAQNELASLVALCKIHHDLFHVDSSEDFHLQLYLWFENNHPVRQADEIFYFGPEMHIACPQR